ncbi:MAG: hypothetical protein EXR75_04430 [Myxococcales bacterium]|nr:hypothetical protein [Myxococcales bacterium]
MHSLTSCTTRLKTLESLAGVAAPLIVAAAALLGCSSSAYAPPPAPHLPAPPPLHASGLSDPFAQPPRDALAEAHTELKRRIGQFVPVTVEAKLSHLPEREKQALAVLIEAARLLVPIYDRQSYAHNPEVEQRLLRDTSAPGKSKLHYWRLMRGPWDRLDHHAFAIDVPKPKGGGFYPEDLSVAELDLYIKAHPDAEKALLGLFTVVQRNGAELTAIPYSKAYQQWLEPAAGKLREAGKLTQNRSLSRFLESRAAAFLSDDYYRSDKDWMDLDSAVEVTIGPYETYEDELKGQKASFEAFVTVADPEASKQLAHYKSLLGDMQKNLPVDAELRPAGGKESPIRVVDLVYASGDARRGIMTIAFNLPNDERVRKEKGAKKVLLRNVIETKFAAIMRPIGERILTPEQLPLLTAEAFFNEVLFHELSHSLGPAKAKKDGKEVDVNAALEEHASALEEAKADVMGAYNVLFLVKKKVLPEAMRGQILVTYFAGLFRSVRFGVEAHGRGAAMQINRFIEEKAATFDPASGRLTVDLDRLEHSITELVRDICVVQYRGDKAAAGALLDKYGVPTPPIEAVRRATASVPVDLAPRYPIAGE